MRTSDTQRKRRKRRERRIQHYGIKEALVIFFLSLSLYLTFHFHFLVDVMGIPLFWPHMRQEGYEAAMLWQFPSTPLPPNAFYRIDILSCFYSTIQRIYTSTHDQHICNIKFEQHLISYGVPKNSYLYFDGPSPDEKHATLKTREAKRDLALQKAQACISDMEARVSSQRKVRKRDFNKLFKNIRAAFYWSQESRSSLAHHLTNNGWNAVVCPSEADIAIAADCQPKDIVISGDSDMLIYDTVETVWRPLSRGRFLVYELAEVMVHLSISRAQLTTLGIVSKNDYSSNLTRLGISTNYKIVKSLEKTETGNCNLLFNLQRFLWKPLYTNPCWPVYSLFSLFLHDVADVQKLIQQYLVHSDVVCKNPSATHFQAATNVFVHRTFTAPDSTIPLHTPGQEATAQDGAQQCGTVKDIFERLEALRLKLNESKKR